MITSYERSDIIHIMKINRLTLVDSDTAHLQFSGQVATNDYRVNIAAVEDLPQVFIERNGEAVCRKTFKSVDDLKIFLEEQMYQFVKA